MNISNPWDAVHDAYNNLSTNDDNLPYTQQQAESVLGFELPMHLRDKISNSLLEEREALSAVYHEVESERPK
jgi:hypothetical protein